MSFQKAAEELFVTPAALSYQIRHLEDHLGLKLFTRLNRSVELTDHGNAIAPGIREAFERLAQTMRQLNNRRATNVLVISAGPGFTAKWLAPRLYRFLAKYPEIDTRISAAIKLADLETDDIDVAIRFGLGIYPNCRAVKLCDDYVTPMCSPSLLNGDLPLATPADLSRHTLIHDDTHVGFYSLPEWPDWLSAAGVEGIDCRRSVLYFKVVDHSIDAAVSGGGVVLGRTFLAQNDLESGRLIAPFELKLKTEMSFYAVSLDSRIEDPKVKAFREWLLQEIAGEDLSDTPGPAI